MDTNAEVCSIFKSCLHLSFCLDLETFDRCNVYDDKTRARNN